MKKKLSFFWFIFKINNEIKHSSQKTPKTLHDLPHWWLFFTLILFCFTIKPKSEEIYGINDDRKA